MGNPLYPRGFATPGEGSTFRRHDGDEEVTRLFYDFVQRRVDTSVWSYRRQVILAAVRLFGNFNHWLSLQDANDYLHGRNYEFLQDTVHYLQNGMRQVSVNNWPDLMEYKPEKKDRRQRPVVGSLANDFRLPIEQVLSLWCSRAGGFEDLVCSLYLFFGTSR